MEEKTLSTAAEEAKVAAATTPEAVTPDTPVTTDSTTATAATDTAAEEAAQAEAPAKAESETPAEAKTAEAPNAEAPAEATTEAELTTEASAEAPADEAPKAEAPARRPDPADKAGIIARLKEIIYAGGEAERAELDHLKSLYYRYHNAEAQAAHDKFIADGGAPEDYRPEPDALEEEFKAQFALIRELRSKAAAALEAEKKANLERKQAIIDRIKELSADPDTADKGYDEVKKLQAEWREIRQVPAEQATELWKNYQLYTEQFYDQLRLNHEMRAYDFKKNLEAKTHLCEAAERLAQLPDVISAFHQLQKLHQEWRETGPVAKELREEIWKRFKDASTVINKRHQDHFTALKAQEEENLVKKTELCQRVEALEFDGLKNFSQWDKMAKEVIALQAEWKGIGFTPRKLNNEIYERFRTACDRFFKAKNAFLKEQREQQAANLAAKNALIEQAEALKDSTDWAATTGKLVELQKQWKAIGPVSHKVSDAIWKRFNAACNHFFEQKNTAGASQRKEEEANLALKREVIAGLEKLAGKPAKPADDDKETAPETPAEEPKTGDALREAVRALQARWDEIGHVPYSKKEKLYRRYRALCDELYDTIRATAGRRRIESFRTQIAEKGGSELSRERARLQSVLDTKRQELTTYETNLTFFTSKSKGTNPLLADAEKRVERIKRDIDDITAKIKALAEKIKAEEK